MAKWVLTAAEKLFVVFIVVGSVFLTAAAFHYSLNRTHWNDDEDDRVIRITGIHIPCDAAGDHLVYAGSAVFTVSDRVLQTSGNENPWFLFGLGKEYRVRTRGVERSSWFGPVHPEILQAEELSGSHEARVSFSR